MKIRRLNPLPRTVRDFAATPTVAMSPAAPRQETAACRTVTIRADVERIAADLERELRVALDGEIVALVAGRIRR
jgi:hypothetical protein